jgi:hypothetical protein
MEYKYQNKETPPIIIPSNKSSQTYCYSQESFFFFFDVGFKLGSKVTFSCHISSNLPSLPEGFLRDNISKEDF